MLTHRNHLDAGAIITCVTAFVMLAIGYRLLKIPMGLLTGMLSGLQTQPAALGFALEQAGNDLPNIGAVAISSNVQMMMSRLNCLY